MMSKERDNWMYTLFISGLLILCIVNGQAQVATEEQIVKYRIKAPLHVQIGESFNIDVLFTVQRDWYIYTPDGANAAQGKIETKVVFNPAPGIIKEGRIRLPDPVIKDGHRVYEGDSIVMSQAFNTAVSFKPGRYEIKGKVIYQTCNSEICLPPITEEIIAVVNAKMK